MLGARVNQVSGLQPLIAEGSCPIVRDPRIHELLHFHPRAVTLSRRKAQALAAPASPDALQVVANSFKSGPHLHVSDQAFMPIDRATAKLILVNPTD